MDTLLNTLDTFQNRPNIFQIKTSFLHITVEAVQESQNTFDWENFSMTFLNFFLNLPVPINVHTVKFHKIFVLR